MIMLKDGIAHEIIQFFDHCEGIYIYVIYDKLLPFSVFVF